MLLIILLSSELPVLPDEPEQHSIISDSNRSNLVSRASTFDSKESIAASLEVLRESSSLMALIATKRRGPEFEVNNAVTVASEESSFAKKVSIA